MPESSWKWEITNWRWWLVFHLLISAMVLYGPRLQGHVIIWWVVTALISFLMVCAVIAYSPQPLSGATRASRNKSIAIIALGPLLVIIYAYSRVQYSAGQAYDELERLCNLDAGTTIYRTINAAGYFDDYGSCYACWNDILATDYKFIEFCDDSPPDYYAINEPGCWRIYKEDKDSPDCSSRINTKLRKKLRHPPVAKFLEQNCFATKRLKQPTAEAGYFRETASWSFDNYLESEFDRQRRAIVLLNTDETLAEHQTYSTVYIPKSSARSTENCETTSNRTPFVADLIPKVIIP